MVSKQSATYTLAENRFSVQGDWTVETVGRLDNELRAISGHSVPPCLDVSELGALDTAGAFIIDRTVRQGCTDHTEFTIDGEHPNVRRLMRQIWAARSECPPEKVQGRALSRLFERIGRGAFFGLQEGLSTLSFVGQTLAVCLKLALLPAKIRWTAVVAVMEDAGVDAIPIVTFLSFFVGMVIAFIGAATLSQFGAGAEIFTVELVGIATMREFGVVLTAIILAGRTNSAFTAQIGAMRMRQEVDAMQVLGMNPLDVLVAPRVIAMLVMTPILAFLATLAGIFGGAIVSWLTLDIPPILFANRLLQTVGIENFWVGMSKAPIFALVVALIGCRQGLLVEGSVQSLGRATTSSVVQAIFTIIVIDAAFAMFYLELGI